MALIVSGITIPTSGNPIKVGNTTIDKVVCNGVTVWERVVFTTKDFSYTGGIQSVKVPAGLYKLEVWGAQGGNYSGGGGGGKGGYSCRYYYFSSETTLYVGVGGQGSAIPEGNKPPVGYNGGSPSWYQFHAYTLHGGTGGGATHIAMTNNRGELKNYASYKSEVLVVAGGGGGGGICHQGYTNWGSVIGGNGGGLTGSDGRQGSQWDSSSNFGKHSGQGGTQSAGGRTGRTGNEGNTESGTIVTAYDGVFGLGGYTSHSSTYGSGGGGGYYGGGAGGNYNGASAGGGGSGYIGVSSYVHNGTTYTNTSTAGQQSGNGKAKITYISS